MTWLQNDFCIQDSGYRFWGGPIAFRGFRHDMGFLSPPQETSCNVIKVVAHMKTRCRRGADHFHWVQRVQSIGRKYLNILMLRKTHTKQKRISFTSRNVEDPAPIMLIARSVPSSNKARWPAAPQHTNQTRTTARCRRLAAPPEKAMRIK